jgi:hypothetical protein
MASIAIVPGALRRLKILRRPSESIRPSSPRPERRDCHARLLSALCGVAGDGATTRDERVSPWHSATFVGTQHHLTLVIEGADAAVRAGALAQALPEHRFNIHGHIVADLAVDSVQDDGADKASLALCLLTIEAW